MEKTRRIVMIFLCSCLFACLFVLLLFWGFFVWFFFVKLSQKVNVQNVPFHRLEPGNFGGFVGG